MLIAVEGVDGVGKTTARKQIGAILGSIGHRPTLSLTRFGWRHRGAAKVITNARFLNQHYTSDYLAEAFVLDKQVLCDEIIRPALSIGHVVCDRFTLSDVVYGWIIHGMAPTKYLEILRQSTVLAADLVVLITSSLSAIESRMAARDGEAVREWDQPTIRNRLVDEYKSWQLQTQHGLLWENLVVIENNGTIDDLHDRLDTLMQSHELHDQIAN